MSKPPQTPSPPSYIYRSAAEMLAAVVVDLFPGTEIVDCAATEQGFICDFFAEQPIDSQALVLLEEKMRALVKENVQVRAIDMMKENAAQFLEHKGQHIRAGKVRQAKSNIITLFQMGDFADFCELPYISHTQEIGVFKLLHIEEIEHYLPEEGTIPIKRIHGTACQDKAALKKYAKIYDAAKKIDYRQLANELKLFSHQDAISDRAFVWGPAGAILRQNLLDWWAQEHRKQHFIPVVSPQLVKESLIKKSGLYDLSATHYEPPMVAIEAGDYVVPPSLTPSHAALFRTTLHSYREIPVRYAECAQIIPMSKAGRLRGMLNTDLVTADYAHIFSDFTHLKAELISSLQFIDKIIKMFGFEYYWSFLGRENKSAGTEAQWEKVTKILDEAFRESGMDYVSGQQEYAFAGPAAEAQLVDSLGREWKGPKIAIDFNIPERFGLRFQGADNKMHMPLLVVRSVFGSVERFVALLLEHTAGFLPLWLAPEQIRVFPVKGASDAYAKMVCDRLAEAGFRVSANCKNDEQLGKKIHAAETEKVPYVVVVGEKEENNKQITLRSCDDEAQLQTMTIEELLRKLSGEMSSKALRKLNKRAK